LIHTWWTKDQNGELSPVKSVTAAHVQVDRLISRVMIRVLALQSIGVTVMPVDENLLLDYGHKFIAFENGKSVHGYIPVLTGI
jgi:hypothetical protein